MTTEVALRTELHPRFEDETAEPGTVEQRDIPLRRDRAGRSGLIRPVGGRVGARTGAFRVRIRRHGPHRAGQPRKTTQGCANPSGTGRIAENAAPHTIRDVIAYLRGTARARNIVDVDGVGYLVHCATPLVTGANVELHVHTQVRDDAITLYGFASETEKAVFEALTKVTGVGPTSALALLAGLGAGGVVDALRRRDTKALSSVKGIGAKVAEKIVTLANLPDSLTAETQDPRTGEIVTVLVSLGFDRKIALEAVAEAIAAAGDGDDEARVLTDAINHAQNRKGRP